MDNNKLRKRASKAFNAKFRDKLANAVQKWINGGGKIGRWNEWKMCKCPEGCLFLDRSYPGYDVVQKMFGFTEEQHQNFQDAFDDGTDRMSPESALGLLYRQRFVK